MKDQPNLFHPLTAAQNDLKKAEEDLKAALIPGKLNTRAYRDAQKRLTVARTNVMKAGG